MNKTGRKKYFSKVDIWVEKILPSYAIGFKLVVYDLLLEFEFERDTYMYDLE